MSLTSLAHRTSPPKMVRMSTDDSVARGLRKTPKPLPGVSTMSSVRITERTRSHHSDDSADVPDSGRLRGSAIVVGVECVVERVEGEMTEMGGAPGGVVGGWE
eukprot:7387757-Prymnesium_polylepis.1